MLLFCYIGAIVYLKTSEKAFIYRPGERHVWPPARAFALQQRTVTYQSSGGITLSSSIIPAAADRPSDMWLLICHGNYGNVGYGQRPEYTR